jgi:hypothetical protein
MNNNRRNYRNFSKPRWEVEKEEAERARIEQMKRNMEDTEENFPGLGKVTTKAPSLGPHKFSELATDWKKTEDEQKEEEERRKQQDKRITEDGVFLLPRFTPSNRFVEQDDQPEETTVVSENKVDDESGWVTVNRNAEKQARIIRKNRRKEEQIRRMDEGEESSSSDSDVDENGESCWNDKPPEHETCWDDRRP